MSASSFDQMVGRNVRAYRRALELTQAEVAATLTDRGMSFNQQMVAKVERGVRPLRFEEALTLASMFGITPEQLAVQPVQPQLFVYGYDPAARPPRGSAPWTPDRTAEIATADPLVR